MGMHSKKVRMITAFAGLVSLLWIFALGWSIKDYLVGATSNLSLQQGTEQATETSAELKIIALGDSLTRGTGDIEGKGYVGYVSDQLKQAGKEVSLVNLGIKGLTSSQLAEQMKQKEIGRQIGQADVILMTIGGNDLFLGGQSLSDLSEHSISGLEEAYLIHLKTILTNIRAVNTEATIYLLGLYNPFSEFQDGDLMSTIVRDWNYKTADTLAAYSKAVFVPTYDLFQLDVAELLFTDHFHPNEKGYRLMAERVAALIAEAGGQL